MRKFLILSVLLMIVTIPVSALDLEAPKVPEEASAFMPSEPDNLAEAVLEMIRDGILYCRPDLKEAARISVGIIAVVMLLSILGNIPGSCARYGDLAAACAISILLMGSTGSMIHLGIDTVAEISAYGKLLLPVMAAALAAQGGVASSAAVYTSGALFSTLMSSLISSVMAPLIYLYLVFGIGNAALGTDILKRFQDSIKSFMTWSLKTILYIFTAYISITGVISGTTDAAALKAAKLTISSVVPVVGGILSDASETILVSASMVKNAAGIYGLFAILAIWIGPFLRIGCHYLMLKGMGALCAVFSGKNISGLIESFSVAMGHLLAMTGAACLMLLVSTICFMKGVG